MKFLGMSIFLLAVTFSNASHASENKLAKLLMENPEDKAYEVLNNFFDVAQYPASFNSFQMYTPEVQSYKECVSVTEGETFLRDESPFFHSVFTIKGQPSRGPLFPGTPDVLKDVIGLDYDVRNPGSLASVQTFTMDGRSLISQRRISTYSNGDIVYVKEVNEMRESDGLIIMKITTESMSTKLMYCWNK